MNTAKICLALRMIADALEEGDPHPVAPPVVRRRKKPSIQIDSKIAVDGTADEKARARLRRAGYRV